MSRYIEVDITGDRLFQDFRIIGIFPCQLVQAATSDHESQDYCEHVYTQGTYPFRLDFICGLESNRRKGSVCFDVPLNAVAYNTQVRAVYQKSYLLDSASLLYCLPQFHKSTPCLHRC